MNVSYVVLRDAIFGEDGRGASRTCRKNTGFCHILPV